jgi:hypothetical protein
MGKTDPDKDNGDESEGTGYYQGNNNDNPEPKLFRKFTLLTGHITLLGFAQK